MFVCLSGRGILQSVAGSMIEFEAHLKRPDIVERIVLYWGMHVQCSGSKISLEIWVLAAEKFPESTANIANGE